MGLNCPSLIPLLFCVRKNRTFLSFEFSLLFCHLHFYEQQGIELVTEENAKSLVGTAGWGLIGATLLGPAGMLAGALAGGNRKKCTFVCRFEDGSLWEHSRLPTDKLGKWLNTFPSVSYYCNV